MSNRHPADWATNLATDIIAEAHRYSYAEAVEIIAVRLRCERARGHAEGLLDSGKRLTLLDLAKLHTPADTEALKVFGIASARKVHERRMERRKLLLDMVADEQADHDDTVLAGHPGFAGVGA